MMIVPQRKNPCQKVFGSIFRIARMFSSGEFQLTRSRRFVRGAAPSAIDIPFNRFYFSNMFARVVSMLAILAVAVMTMSISAHAAHMSIAPDQAVQAVHVSKMKDAAAVNGPSCSCEHSEFAGMDAGTCALICTGLSLVLISPSDGSGNEFAPIIHPLPPNTNFVSQALALNERPPKLRLL